MSKEAFLDELESLINRHSMENGSNTPDFLLAEYLTSCLDAFDAAVRSREGWYGRNPDRGPASAVGGEVIARDPSPSPGPTTATTATTTTKPGE